MKKISYLLALSSLVFAVGANAQKLTPQTVAFMQGQKGLTSEQKQFRSKAKTVKVNEDAESAQSFKAFITLRSADDAAILEKYGVQVMTAWSNFVTAVIPVDAVEDLVALDEIENIAIGTPVTPLVDVAREWTSASYAQENTENLLPQTYTGKGVVVGVIDTGLEYNHRSFRNSDDTELRIKRVWDQNTVGATPAGYNYGAEYTTPEGIRNAKYDNYSNYHATHVMGIAAGAKIDGCSYYGMAPESEIVFVSMGDNGEDVDIVNGVKYIFDYAESVGKPCVINMSLGSHQGPHDGTSVIDQFFATAVGEGRLLVGACGNEAEGAQHASKTFTAGDTTFKTALGYPSTSPTNVGIEVVGSKGAGTNMKLRVAVVDITKKGKVIAQSDQFTCESVNALGSSALVKTFDYASTGTDGYFYIYPGVDSERPCFYIESYCTKLDANRKLAIIVDGVEGDEVHLWNLTGYDFVQPSNATSFTAGDNDYTVGEIGGVSPDVISVGSFNSRNYFPVYWATGEYGIGDAETLGTISYFSSKGPTLDGRIKPDVVAPGYLVISAVNQYYGMSSNYWPGNTSENQSPNATGRVQDKNYNYYYYSLSAGTSMSSPCVAGIMAQWLEADPTLTTDKVIDVFKHSCFVTSAMDYKNMTFPNNTYGYGLIDSYSGLKYILNITGVDDTTFGGVNETKVWADKAENAIYCVADTDATVTVHSVSGAAVGTYNFTAGTNTIDASQWQHGLYLVTVKAPSSTKTVKVVL